MTHGVLKHATARVHYLDGGGDGIPVLFLHSNSALKEAFHLQFEALREKGYRPVALDFPGHGQSSNAAKKPDQTYTISHYATLTRLLIEELSLDRPIVVGWSLGGHVGIEYVGRGWPYRGLLITGTPPVGPGLEGAELAFLPHDAGLVTGMRNPSAEQIDQYVDALYWSLDPIPAAYRNAAHRTDGRARETMLNHWMSGTEGCHQPTVVNGMTKPLCIVHGQHDVFVSIDYLKSLPYTNEIHRGSPVVIENVGHSPFLEAPSVFNDILIEFCGVCKDRS